MSVSEVVERILALRRSHPIRVGIDGFCGAGKTTLAGALLRDHHEQSWTLANHPDPDPRA